MSPSSADPKVAGGSLSGFARDLAALTDNHAHGSLRGKVVVDLACGDPELAPVLQAAGAAEVVTLTRPDVPDWTGHALADLAMRRNGPVDVVFFDVRAHADFDAVGDCTRLLERLRPWLRGDGLLFAVLRSASPHPGFDVANPLVQTPAGRHPTDDHFFDRVCADWAVRMLRWLPSPHPAMTTRFLRLAPKRPTLLLVAGRSQAGKTTLAREFTRMDVAMHLSNDYVYCEIQRLCAAGHAQRFPAGIAEAVGDGSGEACGRFNRRLDADPELLKAYLGLVADLLPPGQRLLSTDIDLREPVSVARAAAFFEGRGYSVWVVQRPATDASA